jgi:hypothetical protein
MVYAMLGFTLLFVTVPIVCELIMKGWRQTIVMRVAREISESHPWLSPAHFRSGGTIIRLGSRRATEGDKQWQLVLRGAVAIAFGSVIAQLLSFVGSVIVAILVSILFKHERTFLIDLKYLMEDNPYSQFGFLLTNLAGIFAGGVVAGEIARRFATACGFLVGLVSIGVGIIFYRLSGTTLVFPAWLGAALMLPDWFTYFQFALSLPVGMLGGYSTELVR